MSVGLITAKFTGHVETGIRLFQPVCMDEILVGFVTTSSQARIQAFGNWGWGGWPDIGMLGEEK